MGENGPTGEEDSPDRLRGPVCSPRFMLSSSIFQGCIFASDVIATFCPPSGRDPCFYQQPLSRKAPPAGGDEDTAAAPGENGIFFIFVWLYRLFFNGF